MGGVNGNACPSIGRGILQPLELSKAGAASVRFDLPPEILEAIAERAADLIAEREIREPERWIGPVEAAEHLCCPRSRIYALVSARRIPHERDGSRLLFQRSTLDAWIRDGGGIRP